MVSLFIEAKEGNRFTAQAFSHTVSGSQQVPRGAWENNSRGEMLEEALPVEVYCIMCVPLLVAL